MICILSIFQSFLHHFEHKYAPFQSTSIHFVTEHKKDGSIRTLIQENFWGISIRILRTPPDYGFGETTLRGYSASPPDPKRRTPPF